MARRKPGASLFEVLAKQQKQTPVPPPEGAPAANGGPQTPLPPATRGAVAAARPLSGQEILFGRDTAFVLFVAVAMLIASAYMIGHEVGTREAKAERPKPVTVPDAGSAALTVRGGLRHDRVPAQLDVGRNKVTLQVFVTEGRTEGELAQLREDRQFVLGLEALARHGVREAYIFDTGKLYVLGVGLFTSANDAAITELQRMFRSLNDGPRHRRPKPYAAAMPVKCDQLGTPVP